MTKHGFSVKSEACERFCINILPRLIFAQKIPAGWFAWNFATFPVSHRAATEIFLSTSFIDTLFILYNVAKLININRSKLTVCTIENLSLNAMQENVA